MTGVTAPNPKMQFTDSTGSPLVGGLLYTYNSGTTSPAATYQDAALTSANTNPIVLDDRGECVIFLPTDQVFKYSLHDATDSLIYTIDGVGNIPTNSTNRVVDSVAALRRLSKASYSQVFVTGYYVTGDGGGGSYYLDASDTTSADNGGTIIVASDGGRWKLQDLSNVSFHTFGAKWDGATDDIIAVNKALAAGVGRIQVPLGTGIVSATIVVPSNTELYGLGPASIIKLKNGANTAVLKNSDQSSGNSYIQLRNFTIDGNKTNQTGGSVVVGISFVLVDDFKIAYVAINNTRETCFSIASGSRFHIDSCRATGAQQAGHVGFYLGYGAGLSDGTITNCYAASNAQDGILVETATAVEVIGCTSIGNGQSGVKLGSSVRCSAIGNYCEGNLTGFRGQAVQNAKFVGNTAYRNKDSGFTIGHVIAWNDITIADNQSIENGQAPTSTSYGYFIDNQDPSGTANGMYVYNNIAIDNQGTKTQGRGFSFGGGVGPITGMVLSGNYSKGVLASDYFKASNCPDITLRGSNFGFTGSASTWATSPQSLHRLTFYRDAVTASMATTVISDDSAGRGYIVPRAGYCRSIYVKANGTITAGSAALILRKNGSSQSLNVTISAASGGFAITEVAGSTGVTFAAGDIIQCAMTSTSDFAPSGSINLDVTIDLVY